MSIATLLAAGNIPAQATENLIYVAVEPCRAVDTRQTIGSISAGGSEDFLAYGDGTAIDGQGGNSDGCAHPRTGSTPVAISANFTAVGNQASGDGNLVAYAFGDTAPTASLVNYKVGTNIANSSIIALCEGDTCTSHFSLQSNISAVPAIVDVQGYFYPATGTCPDDMVASGSICIDEYEASVWDAATGGTQISPFTSCLADGSDCSKDSTAGTGTPIYAQSVADVTPTAEITWYQAAQACANVGKRLPTTAEWQAAASGTVDPGFNADPAAGCNTSASGVWLTGASGDLCKSDAGAFDMIGNLWEWTAELAPKSDGAGFTFMTTDAAVARALGTDYNSDTGDGVDTSTKALLLMEPGTSGLSKGANTTVEALGFRCVR
jgi:hypothetical protein